MIVTTVSLMMFDVYIYIILYPPVLLSIRRRLGIDLPGNNRNKSPDRWNRKKRGSPYRYLCNPSGSFTVILWDTLW